MVFHMLFICFSLFSSAYCGAIVVSPYMSFCGLSVYLSATFHISRVTCLCFQFIIFTKALHFWCSSENWHRLTDTRYLKRQAEILHFQFFSGLLYPPSQWCPSQDFISSPILLVVNQSFLSIWEKLLEG